MEKTEKNALAQMFINKFRLSQVMGQEEVYNFLKGHRQEWFTSRDISGRINISVGSVTVCLKKLRENDEVQFKQMGKQRFCRSRL
jgi:Mn-dependent DtxR family transcriptional regulator